MCTADSRFEGRDGESTGAVLPRLDEGADGSFRGVGACRRGLSEPYLSVFDKEEPSGWFPKLLLTADHQPSILAAMFFFFLPEKTSERAECMDGCLEMIPKSPLCELAFVSIAEDVDDFAL